MDATHARVVRASDRFDYAGMPASQAMETFLHDAPWIQPPAFVTQYGDAPSVTNATLAATLNAGAGLLVCYGAGDDSGWRDWNLAHEDLDGTAVASIGNGPYCPVVWNSSCTIAANPPPGGTPSLGQSWMRPFADGACAVYASTSTSLLAGLPGGHEYALMEQVVDLNNRVHGYAIEAAEQKLLGYHSADVRWTYGLLGDPQMTVRVAPLATVVSAGPVLAPCAGGGCTSFDVTLSNLEARPLVNAKVAVYKSAVAGGGPAPSRGAAAARAADQPEVVASTYTDGSGHAGLELPPLAAGTLYWTVEHADGEALLDSLIVPGWLSVEPPSPRVPALQARPSLVADATTFAFGRPLVREALLQVFDAQGRCVDSQRLPAGAREARWSAVGPHGRRLAAGVYLARLVEGGSATRCRVMVR